MGVAGLVPLWRASSESSENSGAKFREFRDPDMSSVRLDSMHRRATWDPVAQNCRPFGVKFEKSGIWASTPRGLILYTRVTLTPFASECRPLEDNFGIQAGVPRGLILCAGASLRAHWFRIDIYVV